MPNWCLNTLTLKHTEPAMIDRAVKAYKDSRLLDEFVPVPKELTETISGSYGDAVEQELHEAREVSNKKKYGYSNWYDFCVGEWGTKWDVGDEHTVVHHNEGMATFNFDSAWSPPVGAYEKLQELGFSVDAMYYEPGMAYAGIFDECGDEYYQFDGMSSSEVRNTIPQVLDDTYEISAQMEEYELENEDDVTRWYKEGVEDTGLTPFKVKEEK